MYRFRYFIGVALCLLSVAGCAESNDTEPTGRALNATATTGSGGIVVCEDSIATEVGIAVLRDGGTAVDAAVATAFALAVTLPKAGNLGGGGFMVVYDPIERDYWSLDFRETAPQAASANMYVELAAKGADKASTVGALAGGIPGTIAGLFVAWERGGYKDWRDLVAPAIALAVDGFVVGDSLAWDVGRASLALGKFESTRELFFKDDMPLASGEHFVQKDLGAILRAIADEGPAPFYRGEIASRLVAAIVAAGGMWTLDDLAVYEPVFRTPVRVELREDPPTVLIAMPPPSSASVVFAQTVALLRKQQTFGRDAADPRRFAEFVEALRLAFADRNAQLGDPAQMNVDAALLQSSEYLAKRAERLPKSAPGDSRSLGDGMTAVESSNTTHVVVMDGRGGVVSLTTTLNASFGSKFVVPGTGIMLNNQMDDFDTQPGKPNLYGLVGTGVNRVSPGARMLSSMAPTIVERNGQPWVAIGARGGPHIMTSVFQVVWHRVFDGENLSDAMSAPRIHHQWLPDRVYFERCCPIDDVRDQLAAMGYTIDYKAQIARVIAAERLPDGRFVGVVDPRVGGLSRTVSD